ncbi:PP2C family protein-serine/threonine phosphatase [Streptomyces hilarionis]|uniref:PP2C family protein-serine/threonine phosphatase n=1 Tax=Streptomyces hilarionis TaxID=2839954 RepID=UPI002119FDCA|nr:SpoIIE family protein phosphatase [Streptomyces hilarionis]MCQ9133206.1 SpoIIE family protein phosphatase [Streptomyces hilarionis]
MTHTWEISTVTDAARARIATTRVAAAHGVPPLERTRLAVALSTRLRQCLAKGGVWRLALTPADGTLRVELTSSPAGDETPWLVTAPCPEPAAGPVSDSVADDPAVLSEALLGADEDAAVVLDRLVEQEELVAFHREELHQTNQGVLALHAELDAAGRAQRDAFAAERAARREAEAARRRLTFLADASAALTASLNHEEIVRRLPELLVPEYARSVEVWLFDAEEDRGASVPRPAAAVLAARTGRPQYAAAEPGGLPGVDDQAPSALLPDRPLLCAPLPTRNAPLGVLTLTPPGDRWDPDDAVMLLELTRRAGGALENARRFEHNRDIAETLQRALLTELPALPGLRLAARYLPATYGLNIGGDWYDAFRQPDGSLIAVIGDVTGHGLHAAVMMSQLRTALRAYAVDGGTPGELLTRLHTFLHHLQPDLYATAVIARFQPGEPVLTWAAAGHPPPVLRGPDGRVRTLDAKPGAMLGIPLHQEIRDHTEPLEPGSTLALYTDGLVERRAQGIDPGIERLSAALGSFRADELDGDLDGSAERILEPMLSDSERDDDVCLLLCHLDGRLDSRLEGIPGARGGRLTGSGLTGSGLGGRPDDRPPAGS